MAIASVVRLPCTGRHHGQGEQGFSPIKLRHGEVVLEGHIADNSVFYHRAKLG